MADRRDVLRTGAALGGGLLASAFVGGTAASTDDTDSQSNIVGYMSRSSYYSLTGADDVDCVPDEAGWGGTFYVKGVAEDGDGETGVSVEVPSRSPSDGMYERCQAYTVTANEHVELTGGPSGHGPWEDPCGTWVFPAADETLEPAAVYRVSNVYDTKPVDAFNEDVTATDSDGNEIGSPMDLICVTFEQASPAEQWTQSETVTDCGSSVAVDGTTAVLGPAGEGAACILTSTADGWTQEATLGDGDDIDGGPVFDGDTVLFAGPRDGDTYNRSVLVYAQTDGGWERQTTLLPDGLDENARFGGSYDVDGDTLAVGAPEDPGDNEDNRGAVYVYERDGGEWTLETTLEDGREVNDTADGLGAGVAVDGDTILAGAPYASYYDFGFSSVGGALVFTRSDGEWTQETFLRSGNPNNEDGQGSIVALDGDTAVLANPRAPSESNGVFAGAAWVFTREGSEWHHQQKVTPEGWGRNTFFAPAIDLEGDTLLAGSSTTNYSSDDRSGVAYVFTRDDSTWNQQVRLTATDRSSEDRFGDRFGSSVALEGELAFIGAPYDENPDDSDGSVYVFEQ